MSGEISLSCQRYEIQNDGVTYSYFLGALDAKDLKKVSGAPSFEYETPNEAIAREVLSPPTHHWQRPLKSEKVAAIAERFDMPGEIMPNPVLLAVNPNTKTLVSARLEEDANKHKTGLWTIRIPVPTHSDADKPLWIIDGQHRLMGLAQSKSTISPLPFVLLYSDQDAYLPSALARIFAQVTTEATALNQIHQSWMQFVFNLGDYVDSSPAYRAMKTTALLCSTQLYEKKPNAFYGKIGFNPELEPMSITPNGFSFDAKYLQDLLKDKYFKNQGGEHYLTEHDVAAQLSLAIYALKGSVKKEIDRSAFFGDGLKQQKYFRDGFIAGVCAYLLEHGKAKDWVRVLDGLHFSDTNWDVSDWVNSTSGSAGTISKNLAFACFEEVFRTGLPEGVDDICQYLQGKKSYLKIEYQLVDDEDRRIKGSANSINIELPGGIEKVAKDIPTNARYIKITSPCKNAGRVSIALKERPYDEGYSFSVFKKGKDFTNNELKVLKNKIVLNLKVDFYGDVTIRKELTLNVRD
jgi:DGQHR domain-containing protein